MMVEEARESRGSWAKRVLFISSTGGHFAELLALRPLFETYDFHIAVERDETTESHAREFGDHITYLPRGSRDEGLAYVLTFARLVVASWRLLRRLKPEALVTTGTHTAVPACYLAKVLGIRVIYIETIANLHSRSLAGRLVYPVADLFLVQWESMLELYPKAVYAGRVL